MHTFAYNNKESKYINDNKISDKIHTKDKCVKLRSIEFKRFTVSG